MNHQRNITNSCEKSKMAKIVSSRRGSKFLLHNLEESDVVFGTKGNGRNEVFLRLLKRHSEEYMRLSKFEKMSLIQQIIREWKGNFYIMNSKSNDLRLAKKKNHDLSPSDPSSRKLYTSVRRMMNYVNSKTQRKHQVSPRGDTSKVRTPIIPTAIVPTVTTSTVSPSQSRNIKSQNLEEKHVGMFAPQEQETFLISSVEYIRDQGMNKSVPRDPLTSLPHNATNMNILTPKTTPMLISPEPSPRTMSMRAPQLAPFSFSKSGFPLPKRGMGMPPPASAAKSVGLEIINSCPDISPCQFKPGERLAPKIGTLKVHAPMKNMVNEINDLEETAILALTSLGSP